MKTSRPMYAWAVALATLTAAASAAAQEDYKARAWAASCAACHGTNGRSEAAEFPALAGKPKDELLKNLKAFKAGTSTKQPTVMHQHAKGYSDEQLDRIAAYFSRQKR